MSRRHAAPKVAESVDLVIESLDLEAKGIAHREDGKVVFVEGALPFEHVRTEIQRSKPSFEQAVVTQVLSPSAQRVQPRCAHFGLHPGACGGCKMQHLHPAAQVATKQRALEDALWHLGKVRPQTILRPIEGPTWGYRHRARLSVRHVEKKGEVLVGFHERNSRYVADMRTCAVLPPHVSALLLPLRALLAAMDGRDTCPQIELACGDDLTVLVLRHLEPLSQADRQRLRDFADQHPSSRPLQWWLQPKGPDTAQPLDAIGPVLGYRLPEFNLSMPFRPTDFTQVNPMINQVLVSRALRLLQVGPRDRVIDWFCGLGNFTLPLATQAGEVLGIEGSASLLERAEANRVMNGAQVRLAPTRFEAANLFELDAAALMAHGIAHKWLVDPPREGAFALTKALADLHQGRMAEEGNWAPPARIVYVSCNPATLARDAGLLVHQAGYRCSAAGVVNMFPHTAHVESIAVFDWVG